MKKKKKILFIAPKSIGNRNKKKKNVQYSSYKFVELQPFLKSLKRETTNFVDK